MRALATLLLFASVTAANADCSEPQSNYEMKMCAKQDWEKADAALNVAYGKALDDARQSYRSMKGSPGYERMPDNEAMLRNAQRTWIAFRDANCSYHYQVFYGGTNAGLAYLMCMAEMTKSRLKELRQLPGGDESEQ
jgi:uncharacterized protein YecT (DUF1311 family)